MYARIFVANNWIELKRKVDKFLTGILKADDRLELVQT